MKVVVLQSNYIPWKGYFDLINDADKFIFYDEVKYTKNDWRNRNKINTTNGEQWISIPIGKDAVKQKISDVHIIDKNWQDLHFKSLFFGYKRAPYFHQLEPILVDYLVDREWNFLSELNQYLIVKISDFLGCKTKFEQSSAYNLEGDRVGRLLNLLAQAGASKYISGPAARDYLEYDEHLFAEKNINLIYKDYSRYPTYKQLHKNFTHYVSVFDMLANLSIEEVKQNIWGWRN